MQDRDKGKSMTSDVAVIQEPGTEPPQLHRHCLRCRRKLKSEKAMRIGYGSVCAKKIASRGR